MSNSNNKKRVLVVDDDNNLNTVLVDKLNFSGFEAQGAPDGVEGLKQSLDFHPDLILLDLLMPKMGGLAMLKELRKDEWGKGAKVVILTLLEKTDYVAQAMEDGVAGYLVKTAYSLDEVVKKIQEMIDK